MTAPMTFLLDCLAIAVFGGAAICLLLVLVLMRARRK